MPVPSAAELVAKLRANPDLLLSDPEIDVLRREQTDLFAQKMAALALYKTKRANEAVSLARHILQVEPTQENIKNFWVICADSGLKDELARLISEMPGRLDPIDYHALANRSYLILGDLKKCVREGTLCLEAKDRRFAHEPVTQPEWRLPEFNVNANERNIISFSLFGDNPRYQAGAVNNAIVARYVYPSWISRFYVDGSVPEKTKAALRANGAQVLEVEGLPAAQYGTMWRFLIEDDETVDFYLVRDCDSVVTAKEALAVGEWVQSQNAFHVMRDFPTHAEMILAGMWGARRGNIGQMRKRITDYTEGGPTVANYIHRDQHFLREKIWPLLKNNVMSHDSWFDFMNPRRFDPRLPQPVRRHIGQNDWIFYTSQK
ncbi:MAG: hypothetical protein AB7F96_16745 [Beijerinckiaceae bacterium]